MELSPARRRRSRAPRPRRAHVASPGALVTFLVAAALLALTGAPHDIHASFVRAVLDSTVDSLSSDVPPSLMPLCARTPPRPLGAPDVPHVLSVSPRGARLPPCLPPLGASDGDASLEPGAAWVEVSFDGATLDGDELRVDLDLVLGGESTATGRFGANPPAARPRPLQPRSVRPQQDADFRPPYSCTHIELQDPIWWWCGTIRAGCYAYQDGRHLASRPLR